MQRNTELRNILTSGLNIAFVMQHNSCQFLYIYEDFARPGIAFTDMSRNGNNKMLARDDGHYKCPH